MADPLSRGVPSLLLASTPLFASLDRATLEAFDAETHRVELAGGEMLFRQGDTADAMYLVIRGSLNVVVEDSGKVVRHVDTLRRGAVVGEMALLLHDTRTATVVACRDSELLRITKPEFDQLLTHHPLIAIEMARMLGARLKRTTRGDGREPRFKTIALVPAAHADDRLVLDCAQHLAAALNTERVRAFLVTPDLVDTILPGSTEAGLHDPSGHALMAWMSEQEDSFPYVIYQGTATRAEWTRRCVRAADVVLTVATAGSDPAAGVLEKATAPQDGIHAASELVLLHDSTTPEIRDTAHWLKGRRFGRHHHVRAGHEADYQRLARFLTGNAVGLVLSGGGARGFAHIGVIKAMREHHMPIDLIGGASMGAIIAALYATGHEAHEIAALASRAFAERQELDLTVPMVSLNTAAATVRKMKRMFGDTHIEDLLVQYFCVSTNLSRAETIVHDRGPLWLWTRVSCSIPGLAPPVAHDGDLLVDGGLLNNLPADVMRDRCDGLVVGVDVTPDVDLRTSAGQKHSMSGWPHLWDRMRRSNGRQSFPTIVEILSRAALVSSVRDATRMRAHCDIYLKPDVDRFGMSDFRQIDQLVEAGYRAADTCLSQRAEAGAEADHA